MSTNDRKYLKDDLAKFLPNVASFTVTVIEVCLASHPPSSANWNYTEGSLADRGVYSKLKHDRVTMLSARFDLLDPVRTTALQKVSQHTGTLASYHTADGTTVERSYECILKYTEAPKTAHCQ